MLNQRYIVISLFASLAAAQTTTFTAISANNTSASPNFTGTPMFGPEC